MEGLANPPEVLPFPGGNPRRCSPGYRSHGGHFPKVGLGVQCLHQWTGYGGSSPKSEESGGQGSRHVPGARRRGPGDKSDIQLIRQTTYLVDSFALRTCQYSARTAGLSSVRLGAAGWELRPTPVRAHSVRPYNGHAGGEMQGKQLTFFRETCIVDV